MVTEMMPENMAGRGKNSALAAHDGGAGRGWSEDEVPEHVPLTFAQAQELRARHPMVSPWRVLAVQALGGTLLSAVLALLSGRWAWAWSAGWGVLAVVLPGVLFARGLTGRLARSGAGAAVMSFFVWELVKIVATVGVLYVAYRSQVDLNWPALLVGMVVTLKLPWLAVLFRRQTGKAGAAPQGVVHRKE